MTAGIWEVSLPIILITGLIVLGIYFRFRFPAPRALGRVIPEFCVVDAEEILAFKELAEQEWAARPRLRPILRMNQLLISRNYFAQMEHNARRFQQVIRFESKKIDPGKSSLDYDARDVLITDMAEELPHLRSELSRARLELVREAMFGKAIDHERLQALLGAYKALEHYMVDLASMAADTTLRDMLVERLGLSNWRIIPGGGPKPA